MRQNDLKTAEAYFFIEEPVEINIMFNLKKQYYEPH